VVLAGFRYTMISLVLHLEPQTKSTDAHWWQSATASSDYESELSCPAKMQEKQWIQALSTQAHKQGHRGQSTHLCTNSVFSRLLSPSTIHSSGRAGTANLMKWSTYAVKATESIDAFGRIVATEPGGAPSRIPTGILCQHLHARTVQACKVSQSRCILGQYRTSKTRQTFVNEHRWNQLTNRVHSTK
jgi:hypothetical protein